MVGICRLALENNPCQISIFREIKKFFIQELDLARFVCITANAIVVRYRRSDRYLKNWRTSFRIYGQTNGQIDGHVQIRSARLTYHLCLYVLGSPTFSSGCYKLRGKRIYPVHGIKRSLIKSVCMTATYTCMFFIQALDFDRSVKWAALWEEINDIHIQYLNYLLVYYI